MENKKHTESDEYFKLKAIHDENKRRNQDNYKRFSKERLVNSITGRMRTTMIGTLAIIEHTIGHLWGINETRPLTPDEEEILEMWEEIRTQILDLGNNNIRITQEELSHYTVHWDRYKIEFDSRTPLTVKK